MFFRGARPDKIDHWVCVLERNLEYEVTLARNYLANLKIPSNILSKRDSAHSLNIGEMSLIYLYVPEEFEKRAREALAMFIDELEESTVILDDEFEQDDDAGSHPNAGSHPDTGADPDAGPDSTLDSYPDPGNK
jgi:hypothetical protein